MIEPLENGTVANEHDVQNGPHLLRCMGKVLWCDAARLSFDKLVGNRVNIRYYSLRS